VIATAFWNATILGFKIFGFWQLYAAAAALAAMVALPRLFLALLADRYRFGDYPLSLHLFWLLISYHFHFGFRELTDRAVEDRIAGGVPARIFMVFCEVFGTYFFVLALSPIILGLGSHAAWSLPWLLLFQDPLTFLKIAGLIALSALVLRFAPLINAFESVQNLVWGGVVLAFAVANIHGVAGVEFFPDLWVGLGVIAVALAAKWLVLLLLVAVSMLAKLDGPPLLLGMLVGPLVNFLPTFIYGGWLALQIKMLLPME
jgi:hypothetical protein